MKRGILALVAALWIAVTPAEAGYRDARDVFESMPQARQTGVVLALVATGDFEGLASHGFTPSLFQALIDFEVREGFRPDGVLDAEQLATLKDEANNFYGELGSRYYTHPATGARLLVPRKLFDAEKRTPDGMLFTRTDGLMSLSFVSFPAAQKSFDSLWRTLSAEGPGKHVTYLRRFDSHFVVTGYYKTGKFYSWMTRTGNSTTGFTLSWGAPMEKTGRRVSVFLANAYGAEIP